MKGSSHKINLAEIHGHDSTTRIVAYFGRRRRRVVECCKAYDVTRKEARGIAQNSGCTTENGGKSRSLMNDPTREINERVDDVIAMTVWPWKADKGRLGNALGI